MRFSRSLKQTIAARRVSSAPSTAAARPAARRKPRSGRSTPAERKEKRTLSKKIVVWPAPDRVRSVTEAPAEISVTLPHEAAHGSQLARANPCLRKENTRSSNARELRNETTHAAHQPIIMPTDAAELLASFADRICGTSRFVPPGDADNRHMTIPRRGTLFPIIPFECLRRFRPPSRGVSGVSGAHLPPKKALSINDLGSKAHSRRGSALISQCFR